MNADQGRTELESDELAAYGLNPPSDNLKKRVIRAARAEWCEGAAEPEEISWVLPVLRLAACLIVAVALIHTAKGSDAGVRRPRVFLESAYRAASDDTLLSHRAAPLARVTGTSRPKDAAGALMRRRAELHEILEESEVLPGEGEGACIRQIRNASVS